MQLTWINLFIHDKYYRCDNDFEMKIWKVFARLLLILLTEVNNKVKQNKTKQKD